MKYITFLLFLLLVGCGAQKSQTFVEPVDAPKIVNSLDDDPRCTLVHEFGMVVTKVELINGIWHSTLEYTDGRIEVQKTKYPVVMKGNMFIVRMYKVEYNDGIENNRTGK